MRQRKRRAKPLRGRPPTGKAMTAAERMRRMRERRKVAGLKAVVSWVSPAPTVRPSYSSHRLLEARSLAMHAVIAEKIQRNPKLIETAHRNLERWRARWENEAPEWHREWTGIMQRPWPEIAAIITEPSEEGARLRQSTPFAGILSAAERRRIYEAFRA
jgi:hypothetical protein